MSDPVPDPTRRQPPRAEPLQPDHPGHGDETQPPPGPAGEQRGTGDSKESTRRSEVQSDDALDNVREGYD